MDYMEEHDQTRRQSCLGWLWGFVNGVRDNFLYEVDWPLDEKAAEELLSEAGAENVKKAFVLSASRHQEPKWRVDYIILARDKNLTVEEVEKQFDALPSRMYRITIT